MLKYYSKTETNFTQKCKLELSSCISSISQISSSIEAYALLLKCIFIGFSIILNFTAK